MVDCFVLVVATSEGGFNVLMAENGQPGLFSTREFAREAARKRSTARGETVYVMALSVTDRVDAPVFSGPMDLNAATERVLGEVFTPTSPHG